MRDYIAEMPASLSGDWTVARFVQCPFGPIFLWVNGLPEGKCPACDGCGYLMAEGSNGREYEFDCPECDGVGEIEDGGATHEYEHEVWADPDGNILKPEIRYTTSGDSYISQQWLDAWVRGQMIEVAA